MLSVEKPPWGAEPRFELVPALQQASALSTELRCNVRNSYLVEDGTVVLDEGSDGGQALGILLLLISGLLLIGGYTVTKAVGLSDFCQ